MNDHIIKILQAWVDNKQIQFNDGSIWIDIDIKKYLSILIKYPEKFRIEPSFKVFNNAIQFTRALNKHGGYIVHQKTKTVNFPIYAGNTYITIYVNNNSKRLTYYDLFNNWVFLDGTKIAI